MSELILNYSTIKKEATGEIVEKKSRFIANLFPVESIEEAEDKIVSTRKRYYDARHNCYAYIIGIDSAINKCSDDGEPSRSAGMPILEVLKGEGLTNILCVVTRYFGGTLLGTGGLIRAYTDSTKEGIKNATRLDFSLKQTYFFDIDYSNIGKMKYLIENNNGTFLKEDYLDIVKLHIAVPVTEAKTFEKTVTEAFGGQICLESKVENMVYL